MRRPPTFEARQDGLKVYQTEKGCMARAEVGRLTIAIEGCDDEDEAVVVATACLDALAKRRGRQPARVADRTARQLIAALGAP